MDRLCRRISVRWQRSVNSHQYCWLAWMVRTCMDVEGEGIETATSILSYQRPCGRWRLLSVGVVRRRWSITSFKDTDMGEGGYTNANEGVGSKTIRQKRQRQFCRPSSVIFALMYSVLLQEEKHQFLHLFRKFLNILKKYPQQSLKTEWKHSFRAPI